MADIADRASQQEERERKRLIESATAFKDRPAAEFCECGAEIPEARRQSMPGVQTCIDCQEQRERGSAWMRA